MRVVPSKNLDILITAAKYFLNSDCELIIFGDGPDRNKLSNLINSIGMFNKIKIISGITNKDEIYLNSEIFISLSSLEGMSNSLLEAASFGVPCIAYDCQFGAKEILNDGEAGLLLNSLDVDIVASQVSMLIENYSLRVQYSKNAFSHTKNYDQELVCSLWKRTLRCNFK